MSSSHASRTSLLIAVAFGAVAACFVAATGVTLRRMDRIDAGVRDIVDDAAPSIVQLSELRSELQRLVSELDDIVVRHRGRAPAQGELGAAKQRLDAAIGRYADIARYPRERVLWTQIQADLGQADLLAGRALGLAESGHTDAALGVVQGDLRTVVDRASSMIAKSIELNAAHAHDTALDIERTRLRAQVLAIGLDAVSVLLALIAGVLTIRTVRRYTDLVAAHNQLLERRADELEQFAGRVAHDVLGPLGTVGLVLDLSARKNTDPSQLTLIDRGRRGLERVRRIVDGLLSFARSGAQPDPDARADVRGVIDDVVSDVSRVAADANVSLEIAPFEPCAVRASPGVLTSLFSNLLRNAIKYMGDAAVRRVTVRVLPRNGLVLFEVEDTGPGLRPGLERSVFEPYVRGEGETQPGIGLGLATVKRLAEAHRGRVGVRSEPGKGSVFWFELPRAAPAAEPPARG